MLSRVLSSKDRGIYLVCSLVGYLVSLATKPAIWGPYAAMLVTYHFFLVSLLYLSEKKSSRSYSLPVTIAAHLGSIVLLVAVRLAVVTAVLSALQSEPPETYAQGSYLGSRAVRVLMFLAIYGLVSLERKWLFAGVREKKLADLTDWEPTMVEIYSKLPSDGAPLVAATGTDHLEWTEYCARRKSKFYDPRKSPAEDFEQWLRARGKTQYSLTKNQSTPVAN
jgi:hypothetical protein